MILVKNINLRFAGGCYFLVLFCIFFNIFDTLHQILNSFFSILRLILENTVLILQSLYSA